MNTQINKTIKNNAISAYLMVFISWLFLFNKDNININNDFVKKHTKSAILIHILLIINYIIFIYNWLWNKIEIFWIDLNIIIANIIFLSLLWLFIVWIYKAYLGEEFKIWEFIKTNKKISLDINNDSKFDEKDKLTIIFSYIPFLGYIIWWKIINNSKINNIIKFNLIFTIFIYILFYFWYNNLLHLFLLWYIIYVVFIWVNLFIRDELISIILPEFFLPKEKLKLQKNIVNYIINYWKWDFIKYKEIKKLQEQKDINNKLNDKKIIENLKELSVNEVLIYIPIINFIFFKKLDTKYRFHIINWIVISIISLLLIILTSINIINAKILIIILFPICFGIWMLKNKEYKMPYIFDLYEIFIKIKTAISKMLNIIKTKKSEKRELKLKIK